MHGCRLCIEITGSDTADFWNRPLLESPNFVVVPSLGALVPGWLLLVPRKHCLSFGSIEGNWPVETEQMKARIVSQLQSYYGNVCIFEHGPSREKSLVGCGVDHAHLHFVPLDFDLCSASRPFLPSDAAWSPASSAECHRAFNEGRDYLYIEQPIGNGLIATSTHFEGQLLRRAIANQLGQLDRFNWREHWLLSNVESTIRAMKQWNSTLILCQNKAEIAL
jgi:ATP adenylyltransferase